VHQSFSTSDSNISLHETQISPAYAAHYFTKSSGSVTNTRADYFGNQDRNQNGMIGRN